MRERIAMGFMIFVLIMLFAITFYVLGRGEYEPGHGSASPPPVVSTLA